MNPQQPRGPPGQSTNPGIPENILHPPIFSEAIRIPPTESMNMHVPLERTDTSSSKSSDELMSRQISYIEQLKELIDNLRHQVAERDDLISELKSQLDKFQSVLSVQSTSPTQPRKTRLVGVSAQPSSQDRIKSLMRVRQQVYPKAMHIRDIIKAGLYANDFLKNLTPTQIEDITSSMYPIQVVRDSMIIKEGTIGSIMYVLEEGKVEVTKDNVHRSFLTKPGSIFGELAVLYDCTRTASIKAITDCNLWAIERDNFVAIMLKSGMLKRSEYLEFLKTVQIFSRVPLDVLSKIVDALEETTYKRGDYIVRQGARGDTFFIIAQGSVRVTFDDGSQPEDVYNEQEIGTMEKGDHFGEKALISEDVRTASIIAESEKVVCLVIDRETFHAFISPILNYPPEVEEEEAKLLPPKPKTPEREPDPFWLNIQLSDIEFVRTLGLGGFGRVELVTVKSLPNRSYAIKKMKKHNIVQTKQEQHILNEKKIMNEAQSPFIVKLYRTFKDEKYLYMLMDACLGGELWTVLRDRRCFDDQCAKFYTACVIEAFSYLHSRHIIYRDLKPENLLLDKFGYVKLTDFGFAKRLSPPGIKTWTFCGTPDYVSPEIILNRGHDFSSDYWSLGVLMFELLTGAPPFSSVDNMSTYNVVLRGIEAIEFPRHVSSRAINLIKKLCKENPTERLGYKKGGIEDIKKHKWFDGFNWVGLNHLTVRAPYIPIIKSHLDTSNFDSYADDIGFVPTDTSGDWDKDF